jgi:NADH:ubiquinone oxidoreductase subunit 6 (subunit J)
MSLALFITALVTILAAATVMSLRNLVHCALALAVAFSGVAALYLQLDAQFVGFAEILVYVGAIAILIVFAILLTRSGETPDKSVLAPGWLAGIAVSAIVFTMLGWCVLNSNALSAATVAAPAATVKNIGDALMTKFVLPLEIVGLMLTAAMIGAVLIALREDAPKTKVEDGRWKIETPSAPSSILHPPSSMGGQP